MPLLIRITLWVLLILGISGISQTKYFYLAGLLPLFPTFTFIAHLAAASHGVHDLKYTALFGMFAIVPYFFYVLSVYLLADKVTPMWNFSISILIWCVFALIIFLVWNYLDIK